MNGEGLSHEDIVRDLGMKFARMEGRREERDKAVDEQFDSGRARMAAIEGRLGGLEIAAGETRIVVDGVKATADRTEAKVDQLVSYFDQGKGALRAFLTFRRIAIGAVVAAAGIVAWLASNWASVKRFLGMGA